MTKALALTALLLPAQCLAQDSKRPTVQQQSQDGRYVVVFGPFARADVFMIDSHTGRVWHNVVDSKDRNLFEEVPVQKSDNDSFRDYIARIRAEAQQKSPAGQQVDMGLGDRLLNLGAKQPEAKALTDDAIKREFMGACKRQPTPAEIQGLQKLAQTDGLTAEDLKEFFKETPGACKPQ